MLSPLVIIQTTNGDSIVQNHLTYSYYVTDMMVGVVKINTELKF